MSLELDFLAELVKQPNMAAATSVLARRLEWERSRAREVARALAERGIVRITQGGYRGTGPLHVELVRPEE